MVPIIQILRGSIRVPRIFRISKQLIALTQVLGCRGALQYLVQERRLRRGSITEPYTLFTKLAHFPLKVRPCTSDISVFRQIFIEREYACLDDISNVGLIVDCGANVGYSSAYLLSQFPMSHVICVEPDPSNFAMLKENLQPYGDRAVVIQAGVWSHPTELKISEVPYRDGGKWAVQVVENSDRQAGGIRAIDIGSLLKDSDFQRVSILKMDIEGAEVIVFSKNYEYWLSRVDNFIVELHDDTVFGPASDLVTSKVAEHGDFHVSRCGELTVFKLNNQVSQLLGMVARAPVLLKSVQASVKYQLNRWFSK